MGITSRQALDCFLSDDLIGLGMEADADRRQLHPEGVVSYVVARKVCVMLPDFGARVDEAVDVGATSLTLLGEMADLAAWETLLAGLSGSTSLWLHGLSATIVAELARSSGLALKEVLRRLQAAGLRSLAGDDAGLLPCEDTGRCSMQDWLAVHRAAHGLGLPSTATMRFCAGETIEQRVAHLDALGGLQRETGGFVSFRPSAAPLPNFDEATAVEYLKTLAIARMVLDTIPNIEGDWAAQGLKVLQMSLRFGANDVGPTLAGEALHNSDGTTEEDLRRVIRGGGFRPVERDAVYRTMFLS